MKKYIIQTWDFPIWLPLSFSFGYKFEFYKFIQSFHPSVSRVCCDYEATKLNIFQAIYFYFYILLTQKWLRKKHFKIKKFKLIE